MIRIACLHVQEGEGGRATGQTVSIGDVGEAYGWQGFGTTRINTIPEALRKSCLTGAKPVKQV